MRIKLSITENNASHLCITEPKENFATLTDNFEKKESLKMSPTTKIYLLICVPTANIETVNHPSL